VLPTPVFFYGPQPQQEIVVEIDPGKALSVPLATVTVVPEPEQWAMLLLGLGVIGVWHRRGQSRRDSAE
jgi:pyruvate carboxylase